MGIEGYKTITSSVSAWVADIVAQRQAITMHNKNEKKQEHKHINGTDEGAIE